MDIKIGSVTYSSLSTIKDMEKVFSESAFLYYDEKSDTEQTFEDSFFKSKSLIYGEYPRNYPHYISHDLLFETFIDIDDQKCIKCQYKNMYDDDETQKLPLQEYGNFVYTPYYKLDSDGIFGHNYYKMICAEHCGYAGYTTDQDKLLRPDKYSQVLCMTSVASNQGENYTYINKKNFSASRECGFDYARHVSYLDARASDYQMETNIGFNNCWDSNNDQYCYKNFLECKYDSDRCISDIDGYNCRFFTCGCFNAQDSIWKHCLDVIQDNLIGMHGNITANGTGLLLYVIPVRGTMQTGLSIKSSETNNNDIPKPILINPGINKKTLSENLVDTNSTEPEYGFIKYKLNKESDAYKVIKYNFELLPPPSKKENLYCFSQKLDTVENYYFDFKNTEKRCNIGDEYDIYTEQNTYEGVIPSYMPKKIIKWYGATHECEPDYNNFMPIHIRKPAAVLIRKNLIINYFNEEKLDLIGCNMYGTPSCSSHYNCSVNCETHHQTTDNDYTIVNCSNFPTGYLKGIADNHWSICALNNDNYEIKISVFPRDDSKQSNQRYRVNLYRNAPQIMDRYTYKYGYKLCANQIRQSTVTDYSNGTGRWFGHKCTDEVIKKINNGSISKENWGDYFSVENGNIGDFIDYRYFWTKCKLIHKNNERNKFYNIENDTDKDEEFHNYISIYDDSGLVFLPERARNRTNDQLSDKGIKYIKHQPLTWRGVCIDTSIFGSGFLYEDDGIEYM